MDKVALVFEAPRTRYSMDLDNAMTVGELRELLEDWDDDTQIIISHDNGYTYGTLEQPEIWYETEEGWGKEL